MEEENKISNLEKRISSLEEKIKLIENCIVVKSEKSHNNIIDKKLSVKEFLATKKIDDNVKQTLAIAYFIECIEHISSFNTDDLKRFFGLAKIPLPRNINDKVNMNIKNGHFMEAEEKKDSKKAWVLTATGEKYVENDLV